MSELWGVEICLFPLTRLIAYTTACSYRTSRDKRVLVKCLARSFKVVWNFTIWIW